MLQLPAPTRWPLQLAQPAAIAAWARRARSNGRLQGRQPHRWERSFHSDSETSALEQRLRPLARRLHAQRLLESIPRTLLVAVSVLVAATLLARLLGFPGLIWLGVVAAPLTGAVFVWRVARRKLGPFETARRTDASLALRERLATALELIDAGNRGPIAELQIADATTAAAGLDARAAFPYFAPGTEARSRALRSTALALGGLVAVALLIFTWAGATGIGPFDQGRELALAEPGTEQDSIIREPPLSAGQTGQAEAVTPLSQRPEEMGDTAPGLVGNQQNPQGAAGAPDGQQPGQQGQQAQQDARSQQNANVAERQQALQDLAKALRQSQTARSAADSLARGDTQKASEQLNQLASQVSRLSPGERQTLAQSFQQAAQQIGDKDKPLAEAAQRASTALSQFRNQDAQQAIRDAANQVKDSGQQAEAQRQLQQRANELERGGQPQLPQSQSAAQRGQQQGSVQQGQPQSSQSQAGQQGQAGQQSQPRDSGQGNGQADSLAQMESDLRNGALGGQAAGQSSGQGAGAGEGANPLGAPHRLAVDARLVQVEAEERDGPSVWRPPSPNAPPAPAPPPAAAAPGAPPSANPVGASPDLNTIPWDLVTSVQKYFTPDQPAK